MLCSSKPFVTLLLLTLSSTHTLAHSQANGHDHEHDLDLNLNDAACTPAEVDPSPIQHLYAEDGMEVNFILISPDLSAANPRCQGWPSPLAMYQVMSLKAVTFGSRYKFEG